MQSAQFPTARNFKGRGPRSLVSMCSRVLALNIEKARAADLQDAGIPYRVLRSIWSEIKCLNGRSNIPPLNTWVTMSEALRDAIPAENMTVPLELYRRWETIFITDMVNLSIYTLPLTKLGMDYIVSLRITCVPNLDTPDLLGLARLGNLDTLEIVEDIVVATQAVINDRLVRGWSEVEGGFPALTFLRLQPGEATGTLTKRSLDFISKFPLLRVYDVLLSFLTEVEFGEVYEYPSCGWECIWECQGAPIPSGLDLPCPYVSRFRQTQLRSVYEDDDTEIVPTQPVDTPPATANPPRPTYVVRKRDKAVSDASPPANGYGHSRSFWWSALMESMPPMSSRCDEPVLLTADLPLPPKPHVSVVLRNKHEPLEEYYRLGMKKFIFHRRPKLAPSETRRLISSQESDPAIAKLPWHALEKVLGARSVEDRVIAKKRKLEVDAGVDKMPERQGKMQAGEKGSAKQGSTNAGHARQRRLPVKDVGDILKEMQAGRSP